MTTAREKWIEVKASQFAASAEPRSLEQTEQFARDAMALADQTRQEPSNPNVLDDGFGNQWLKCSRPGGCGLQIVRPGKVQCDCEREKQEDGAGDGDMGLNMTPNHSLTQQASDAPAPPPREQGDERKL